VAAARGHHRKAAGARPVDQVADQRRLVTERQRIHHAGLLRLACQHRAAQCVGLDGDVDHVLVLRERAKAVIHRGDRRAGALDDHVDRRMAHQRLPVVADVRATLAQRGIERGGLRALERPAHARQVAACSIGRQVGDAHQVHAWRAWRLRQVHRAELAGADQSHAHRPVRGRALLQQRVQAHAGTRSAVVGCRIVRLGWLTAMPIVNRVGAVSGAAVSSRDCP
jgi:hypothetical protein